MIKGCRALHPSKPDSRWTGTCTALTLRRHKSAHCDRMTYRPCINVGAGILFIPIRRTASSSCPPSPVRSMRARRLSRLEEKLGPITVCKQGYGCGMDMNWIGHGRVGMSSFTCRTHRLPQNVRRRSGAPVPLAPSSHSPITLQLDADTAVISTGASSLRPWSVSNSLLSHNGP